MMPDNFKMATLFPEAAIRVSRPAEPRICVVMEENVSDWRQASLARRFMGIPRRWCHVQCCLSRPERAHCRRCQRWRRARQRLWPITRRDENYFVFHARMLRTCWVGVGLGIEGGERSVWGLRRSNKEKPRYAVVVRNRQIAIPGKFCFFWCNYIERYGKAAQEPVVVWSS